ncbi:MAG TPA: hypothetical protein VF823_07185 [Anaerolineales bacterium]
MKRTNPSLRGSSSDLPVTDPLAEITTCPDYGEVDCQDKKPISQSQDVRMRFLADPQTSEITILIFDKLTQEVLRTISPEELAELREGELIDLIS